MKIIEYRLFFIESLATIYDVLEAENFFYLVLENKNNLKRIDLALQRDLTFTGFEINIWNEILEQLRAQIPIQYILGSTHFYDMVFNVNKNVLIPRPETEELIDWIIKCNSNCSGLKVLDIGTGSGCIAIALAKNLSNSAVFAIDVSKKALATAELNAKKNEVNVTFIEKNILNTSDLEMQFDIIVSNPPYVRNLEKGNMQKNVLENEPHLALFVDDEDPLVFYCKIADLAKRSLSKNGQLYFEINQYLGDDMIFLLQNKGFKNVALRGDIYGSHRMIKAIRG